MSRLTAIAAPLALAHAHDDRIPRHRSGQNPRAPLRLIRAAAGSQQFAGVFVATIRRYLLEILPQVDRELAWWQAGVAEIPSAQLRRSAREALGKRGNVEGAALFATLAPARHRRSVTRALVAFQMAYNYVDALSELPSEDPIANGERLHQALLAALAPGTVRLDYYAHNPLGADGGYLRSLLDAGADAFARLPSHRLAAGAAQAATGRIVYFQALNLAEPQGGHAALRRWAGQAHPSHGSLQWWETAAAAGSSLAVHALIAAAAYPQLRPGEVLAIDEAYFPAIGALHSLLDSLVDRREDSDGGRRCLLDYYDSSESAAARLGDLAARACAAAGRLPSPHAHRVIVTAMASYYLSDPACRTPEGRAVARAVERACGAPLRLATLMFASRRLLRAATRRPYA